MWIQTDAFKLTPELSFDWSVAVLSLILFIYRKLFWSTCLLGVLLVVWRFLFDVGNSRELVTSMTEVLNENVNAQHQRRRNRLNGDTNQPSNAQRLSRLLAFSHSSSSVREVAPYPEKTRTNTNSYDALLQFS